MHAFLPVMLCLALASPLAWAARQDISALETAARAFAENEWQGQNVGLQFGQIDRRLALPACRQPEFAWTGEKRQGSNALKLSCPEHGWSLRLPVRVVSQQGLVTFIRPLEAGAVITAEDIRLEPSRNGRAPAGSFTRIEDVVGKSLGRGVGTGVTLRREMLASPLLVRQNERVKVQAIGPAFSVWADGVALTNGSEGEVIGVRMPGGRTIQGVVAADGSIQLRY